MPSASTIILAALISLIVGVGSYITLFGIPPWLKREIEEKALETMGENKMSYGIQQAMGKVPDSDQQDVKELKSGLGNALGGGMKNPLGKFAGNTADDATKPMTGR